MPTHLSAHGLSLKTTSNLTRTSFEVFPRTKSARSYELYWQFRKLPQRIQRFIKKMCRLPNTAIIVWFSRKLYSFTACCAYIMNGNSTLKDFLHLSIGPAWVRSTSGSICSEGGVGGTLSTEWLKRFLVVIFSHWVTLSNLWRGSYTGGLWHSSRT